MEDTAKRMAASVGYKSVPWREVCYIALVFQLILGILSQYGRKDQITVAGCAIGIYFLECPESLRRYRFRQLVALFFVSMIYDVLWFVLNKDVDQDDSGGIEYNVRRFSRIISYVSFFWRILLCLILERVSFDFLTIVKYKKTSVTHAESVENRVQRIIDAFEA